MIRDRTAAPTTGDSTYKQKYNSIFLLNCWKVAPYSVLGRASQEKQYHSQYGSRISSASSNCTLNVRSSPLIVQSHCLVLKTVLWNSGTSRKTLTPGSKEFAKERKRHYSFMTINEATLWSAKSSVYPYLKRVFLNLRLAERLHHIHLAFMPFNKLLLVVSHNI